MPELNQPLVLYFDETTSTTRAASVPDGIDDTAESFIFRDDQVVRTGCGIFFWDYLVRPNSDIVGLVLIDFDVEESFRCSRLLSAANNVKPGPMWWTVLLAEPVGDAEHDAAQAFSGTLYQHGNECFLYLPDWHHRGYAFPLDTGLIAPLLK
jgi:hypothetical protein